MNDEWGFTKHFEGILDAVFMFAYAIGLYFSGVVGDKFDAKNIQFVGLILTGIVVGIFGASVPRFGIHNHYYFIGLWFINGIVQSTGWPTAVKFSVFNHLCLRIMGNWFGDSHAGFVFGLWSANACFGNIVGAAMVEFVLTYNYSIEWAFYFPAIFCIGTAFLVLFITTEPRKLGLEDPTNRYTNDPQTSTDIAKVNANTTNNSVNNKNNDDQAHLLSQSQIVIDNNNNNDNNNNKNNNTRRRVSFMEALLIPNVIVYSLCYACLKSVNYTMFFWLPFFLANMFSAVKSDQLSMLYDVGQIFGGWAVGWASDLIYKRSPSCFISLLISIVPTILLRVRSHSQLFFASLCFLGGFFVGGPANIISSTISADLGKHKSLKGNPEALATVAGIIDGTGSIGTAFCQYAVSLASDISWDFVFVILTILLVMSALLILPLFYTEMKFLIVHGRKKSDDCDYQSSVDINIS